MRNIPLYTAIGLVAISLTARAEDLSTATAALPAGSLDLSNNLPYVSLLSSSADTTPIWVVPVAKGGDRIEEQPLK
jgi:hypothetical protein